jgi:hypothetical protein
LYSVPFCGRSATSGKRLRKKPPKPKLTKEQKKALQWARLHPEHEDIYARTERRVLANQSLQGSIVVASANQGVIHATLENTLERFIGQPATEETRRLIEQKTTAWTRTNATATAVTSHYDYVDTTGFRARVPATDYYQYEATFAAQDRVRDNIIRAYYDHDDRGNVTVSEFPRTVTTFPNTGSITMNNTSSTITVSDQSWAQWSTSKAPKKKVHDQSWAGWQGGGHEADLWCNPNDRVQQQRLRRARDLATEADRAIARQAEIAQLAVRREARRIEDAARVERRGVAKVRSYNLLHRHLDEDQLGMLENEGRFLIESRSGQLYEIRRGIHQNIYRLNEEGRIVEQLCAAPSGDLPEGDAMLAQMLHLMVNEEGFRQVANKWDFADHRHTEDRRLVLPRAA